MSFHWNDKEPIYLQLKDLVREMILSGNLTEGEALPSVRQVAADYQLNPITVSKSWQLLVDEELVEKRRGLGMFVKLGAAETIKNIENKQFLERDWPKILQKIEYLDLSTEALIDSLKQLNKERINNE